MNNSEKDVTQKAMVDEYELLTIGDIIWAKRYNNELSMLKIPEGHKEGPFIVVGRHEKRLKCLSCSSHFPKDLISDNDVLKLVNPEYSLDKDTYIYITKNCYMARSRFIKRLGHLNKEDKVALLKKINIVKQEGMRIEMDFDTQEIPLEAGDIIKNNNKNYLIVDICDDNYYCVKITKNSCYDACFPVIINTQTHYLNFSSIIKFSKDCLFNRKNFIDNETLKKVLAVLKQKIEEKNHKLQISRGSLVRIDGIKYYIYGEIGNDWMAFPVVGQNKKQLCHIIINNKHFYTNFNGIIQFSKNQAGVELLVNASDKEIEQIKINKKLYKKSREAMDVDEVFDSQLTTKYSINIGSIVKYKHENLDELYIVIVENDEEIVTIKYDNYLKGEYILNKQNKQEVYKIGEFDNLNLKQVLLDIKDIASGYINKKRLEKMIKNLYT